MRKITSKRRDVDIDKLEVSGDIYMEVIWQNNLQKKLVGIYRGDLA